MKNKIVLIVIFLALILVSWKVYIEFFKGNSTQANYYGNIDKRTVKLGFRFVGKIEDIKKDEGEIVKKDEILASLETRSLQESLNELEAKLNSSKLELNRLNKGFRTEEINQAGASYEEAKMNLAKATDIYKRQEKLFEVKAVSEQSFIQSKLDFKQATASLNRAKSSYELFKNGYREDDIKIQESNIKVLEAQIEKVKIDLKDSTILSPVDGVILTRYKEVGAITNSNEAVLEVARNDELWVRAYIDQKNLGEIKTGLKMLVFSDARAKPYIGHISFISSVAEFTPKNIETQELRANLVYSFRVIIKDFDDNLKQGVPVTLQVANSDDN